MNRIAKLQRLGPNKIVRSFHFWIIVAIIATFTIVYYKWNVWFPWFWDFFVFEFHNNIIGSLLFIPFLYASLVFGLKGSLIAWFLSQGVILPCLLYYKSDIGPLLTNLGLSLAPLAAVITITFELEWRENCRKVDAEREKERQAYMSLVLKAQEDERRRIAQELHDDTIQELLVIANKAQSILSIDPQNDVADIGASVQWIRDKVLHISEGVRRISLDLRPSILDNLGLVPALRWLIERMDMECNIRGKLVVEGVEKNLSSDTEVAVFRIVQEALYNIRQHSAATEIILIVNYAPDFFELVIQDNGKGFSMEDTMGQLASQGKLGLLGIEQRSSIIGGICTISAYPGKGTSIHIRIDDHK